MGRARPCRGSRPSRPPGDASPASFCRKTAPISVARRRQTQLNSTRSECEGKQLNGRRARRFSGGFKNELNLVGRCRDRAEAQKRGVRKNEGRRPRRRPHPLRKKQTPKRKRRAGAKTRKKKKITKNKDSDLSTQQLASTSVLRPRR